MNAHTPKLTHTHTHTHTHIAPPIGSKLAELPSTTPLPVLDTSETTQPMDTTPPTVPPTQPSPARSGSSPAVTTDQQQQSQGTTTPKTSTSTYDDTYIYRILCTCITGMYMLVCTNKSTFCNL